jgi:hypothetical protein
MTMPEFDLSDDEKDVMVCQELLRRARERIDLARAADDLAPLLDAEAKLLFSALMVIIADTDAMRALVDRGALRTVSNDEFRAAMYRVGPSERDGIALAARLLFFEAFELLKERRPDIREWISYDEIRSVIPPDGEPRCLAAPLSRL